MAPPVVTCTFESYFNDGSRAPEVCDFDKMQTAEAAATDYCSGSSPIDCYRFIKQLLWSGCKVRVNPGVFFGSPLTGIVYPLTWGKKNELAFTWFALGQHMVDDYFTMSELSSRVYSPPQEFTGLSVVTSRELGRDPNLSQYAKEVLDCSSYLKLEGDKLDGFIFVNTDPLERLCTALPEDVYETIIESFFVHELSHAEDFKKRFTATIRDQWYTRFNKALQYARITEIRAIARQIAYLKEHGVRDEYIEIAIMGNFGGDAPRLPARVLIRFFMDNYADILKCSGTLVSASLHIKSLFTIFNNWQPGDERLLHHAVPFNGAICEKKTPRPRDILDLVRSIEPRDVEMDIDATEPTGSN